MSWRILPLELPGCEAADVDVEVVKAGEIAVSGELNFKLKLLFRDRPLAHGAVSPDTGTAPRAIRTTSG